ncbi:hypothetical protein HK100_008704 [Physocladia obscura]|uniref:Uncharacterized protein n=1 Tax=Physocladia obscura TaxID=109957 RepID=A0AAD5T4H8_9FUNG|nr:hypothetical protein HK100_008704 [Physocladia obscura]
MSQKTTAASSIKESSTSLPISIERSSIFSGGGGGGGGSGSARLRNKTPSTLLSFPRRQTVFQSLRGARTNANVFENTAGVGGNAQMFERSEWSVKLETLMLKLNTWHLKNEVVGWIYALQSVGF